MKPKLSARICLTLKEIGRMARDLEVLGKAGEGLARLVPGRYGSGGKAGVKMT